jgi:endogenous inhibitor of DNA gyrase (YacG/DUF329 family)
MKQPAAVPKLFHVRCPACGENCYSTEEHADPQTIYVCPYCLTEFRAVDLGRLKATDRRAS